MGFIVRGESPGCCLFSTASMLEWLRNLLPTTHRGAVQKDGVEIPWGWSLPECFYILRGQRPPLFLIIQSRWQCHLTWSATHDVVSREINLWKSFDLLLGLNLWPLAPTAGALLLGHRVILLGIINLDIQLMQFGCTVIMVSCFIRHLMRRLFYLCLCHSPETSEGRTAANTKLEKLLDNVSIIKPEKKCINIFLTRGYVIRNSWYFTWNYLHN